MLKWPYHIIYCKRSTLSNKQQVTRTLIGTNALDKTLGYVSDILQLGYVHKCFWLQKHGYGFRESQQENSNKLTTNFGFWKIIEWSLKSSKLLQTHSSNQVGQHDHLNKCHRLVTYLSLLVLVICGFIDNKQHHGTYKSHKRFHLEIASYLHFQWDSNKI